MLRLMINTKSQWSIHRSSIWATNEQIWHSPQNDTWSSAWRFQSWKQFDIMAKGISNCLDDENLRRKILSKSHAIHNKFRFCVHDDRRGRSMETCTWHRRRWHCPWNTQRRPCNPRSPHLEPLVVASLKWSWWSYWRSWWSCWQWWSCSWSWSGATGCGISEMVITITIMLAINYNSDHDGVDITDDYDVDGETAFVYMWHIWCLFDWKQDWKSRQTASILRQRQTLTSELEKGKYWIKTSFSF